VESRATLRLGLGRRKTARSQDGEQNRESRKVWLVHMVISLNFGFFWADIATHSDASPISAVAVHGDSAHPALPWSVAVSYLIFF